MLIQSYQKYEVLCKNVASGVLYRWHLNVIPGNKAWKVVYMDLRSKTLIKGYSIIYIKDLEDNNFTVSKREARTFNKTDFHNKVDRSDLGYAARPLFSQAYKCDICGGVVANNICTDCMFDWDE